MTSPHSRLFLVTPFLVALGSCGAPGAPEAPAPAAGRAQPEVAPLTSDVAWLADDERQGRRAGTAAELACARWLAQRLARLGLEPAGSESWLQAFEVPLPARDGGTSSVAVGVPEGGGTHYTLLADPTRVVPLFCSEAGEVQGRVAFGGYGITAPDLGWNDYGARDMTGAVVVVVRGTPPDELARQPASEELANPHGDAVQSSGWGGSGSIFHKVMEAKRRGALAVLVAQHPDAAGEPLLAFDAGRTAEAKLPALMIDSSVAERLVPGYAELVGRIDQGEDLSARGTAERTARVKADVIRGQGVAHNVLARLPGKRSERTVVIGAHFDHLGLGGPGSLALDAVGEIHNGADDNASGTAVVLEVARCLSQWPRPEGDIVFALWSGEELGLLGSEYWAEHPTVALEDVRANINLDMVGRAGDGVLQVLGAGSAAPFEAWLQKAGPAAELELTVSLSGQGTGGSDHQTFLRRDIPALHLFSGIHPDYHKPSDDVQGFEAEGARRVALLTMDLVAKIQGIPELAYVPPDVSESQPQVGGFKTRFGSIPEYSYDGEGMLLAGTSEGGPAERAGLLKGDLILAIDDIQVEGLGDFMFALNTHKPGDVVLVEFVRGGEELTCRVTLESTQVE